MNVVAHSTDEQLVEQWRLFRCQASVNELLDRHASLIRALILRMGIRRDDVDDLAQEILVRALGGLDRFNADAKFSTWLHVIAVNRIRNHFRTRDRQDNNHDSMPELVDKRNTTPDQQAGLSETTNAVQSAISSLTEPLRLAIVLTTQGMSSAEAAQVCDCTVNAFYARVHKARTILKRKLSEFFDD